MLGDVVRFRPQGPSVRRRRLVQALTVAVAGVIAGGVVVVDGPEGRTENERAAPSRPLRPAAIADAVAAPPSPEAPASPPPPAADPVAVTSVEPPPTVMARGAGSAGDPRPARPVAVPVPVPEAPPGLGPWVASSGPLAASAPVRVDIPGVRTTAPVDPLGLNRDGTLEVPDRFSRAGWYTGRPTPGETGPAIIVAHRAGRRGPGAFWRLPEVQPGTEVVVTRADGSRVVFVVERLEQHRKDAFPTEAVYGPTSGAELRLITCGGPFEPNLGDHYRDNVIVFARLAGQML